MGNSIYLLQTSVAVFLRWFYRYSLESHCLQDDTGLTITTISSGISKHLLLYTTEYYVFGFYLHVYYILWRSIEVNKDNSSQGVQIKQQNIILN